ncbi:MAG: hypothetical protein ACOCP8_05365 [archaeon]
MDKCPKCAEYSLYYDEENGKAKCVREECGFSKKVESREEYSHYIFF